VGLLERGRGAAGGGGGQERIIQGRYDQSTLYMYESVIIKAILPINIW
jgi:hypothetical protein